MRNRLQFLLCALVLGLPLCGATPAEEQRLDRVRRKVVERRAQLEALYAKHGLDADWARHQLDLVERSQFETERQAAEDALQRLEAEINLIKIKQTHGVDLALSGMIIVFTGLASISIFIGLLPKMLALRERRSVPAARPVAAPARPVAVEGLDEETLAALALVLHAESERATGQNLKVTLGLHPSPWALSSQMRVLPGRIQT